jgi:hypothetical protein
VTRFEPPVETGPVPSCLYSPFASQGRRSSHDYECRGDGHAVAWPSRDRDIDRDDPTVSGDSQSATGTLLPIRAELQPLHGGMPQEVRLVPGAGEGPTSGIALPPLASGGIRPAMRSRRMTSMGRVRSDGSPDAFVIRLTPNPAIPQLGFLGSVNVSLFFWLSHVDPAPQADGDDRAGKMGYFPFMRSDQPDR